MYNFFQRKRAFLSGDLSSSFANIKLALILLVIVLKYEWRMIWS